MSTDLILVLGMSVVTMIPRMLPAFLAGRWTPPRRVRQWLDAVPYAALGALIVPGIFQSDPVHVSSGALAAAAALVAALLRAPVFIVGLASVAGAILARVILP